MNKLIAAIAIVLMLAGSAGASDPNTVPAACFSQSLNIVRVNGNDGSWGSGTYIGGGYVLTAAHVLRGSSSFTIYFSDGHTTEASANGWDKTYDQGLLTLRSIHPKATGVPLATANPIKGEHIILSGYDKGRSKLLWRPGIMTKIVTPSRGNRPDWFDVNNEVYGGSSGGPALNAKGELIGNLWGAGDGFTESISLGRTKTFLKPVLPRIKRWFDGIRNGRSPLQICPGGS